MELKTLQSYTEYVSHVSFRPDGKIFASVSDRGKVKLWDAKNGREIKTLKWYSQFIRHASFSPDGKNLAFVYPQGKIMLWNIDLDDSLVQGCRLIKNYLQNNLGVNAKDKHLCDDIKNN